MKAAFTLAAICDRSLLEATPAGGSDTGHDVVAAKEKARAGIAHTREVHELARAARERSEQVA